MRAEWKLTDLTQHSDSHLSCHTAEGVCQWYGVQSWIVSGWPEDHKTLVLHYIVGVGAYLFAIEEPHLLLDHFLDDAALQGEPLSSLYGYIRLCAQSHILDDICQRTGDAMVEQRNEAPDYHGCCIKVFKTHGWSHCRQIRLICVHTTI